MYPQSTPHAISYCCQGRLHNQVLWARTRGLAATAMENQRTNLEHIICIGTKVTTSGTLVKLWGQQLLAFIGTTMWLGRNFRPLPHLCKHGMVRDPVRGKAKTWPLHA